jgi:disulfide bond formation protein DsbB
MTRNRARQTLILTAAGGSALLMLAALGFQYLGDMPPCRLCYWQRYGHVAAIGAGALAMVAAPVVMAWLGAAGAASSAAIGAYHTGVERGWWEGPSSCSAGPVQGLTTEELMAQIMSAPLVRCDEVPWALAGLSMASWNALAALALAALWIAAARLRG